MWFLRFRWVLSGVFALFVGAWGANIELKGRAQADAFCEWVQVGAPAGEIAAAAERLEEEVLRIERDDAISIGFGGVLPLSYHVCSVSTAHDAVSGKERLYVNALF